MSDAPQDSRHTPEAELLHARELGVQMQVDTIVDSAYGAFDVSDDTDTDLPQGAVLPTASGAVDTGPETLTVPVVTRELVDQLLDESRWADDTNEQIAILAEVEPVLTVDEAAMVRARVLARLTSTDDSRPTASSADAPQHGRTRP